MLNVLKLLMTSGSFEKPSNVPRTPSGLESELILTSSISDVVNFAIMVLFNMLSVRGSRTVTWVYGAAGVFNESADATNT